MGGILCVPLSNAPASWDVKVIVVLLTPCFSQYFTGPLVAISLVKDCFFSLSGQSVTNNVLALQCLLKKPCETLRLGNVYEHSEPQETSRGKCSLSLSTPCFPFPSSTPYRQWIWDQRAWERSKVSERKAQMTLKWISTKWSRLSHTITTPKRSFS